MVTFKLSEEQYKKAKEWMSERREYSGAVGGQFSYVFTPTSIGVMVKVTDGVEELGLTDLDSL